MPDPNPAEHAVQRIGDVTEAASQGTEPSEVQVFYSRLLGWGALAALVMMLVVYVLYATGAVVSEVPPERIADYWGSPPQEYSEAVGVGGGWGWAARLGRGECVSLLGPALLGLVTIACFAVALPVFLRKRDWVFAAIVAAEIAVLALSASGLVGGGH